MGKQCLHYIRKNNRSPFDYLPGLSSPQTIIKIRKEKTKNKKAQRNARNWISRSFDSSTHHTAFVSHFPSINNLDFRPPQHHSFNICDRLRPCFSFIYVVARCTATWATNQIDPKEKTKHDRIASFSRVKWVWKKKRAIESIRVRGWLRCDV